MKRIVLPTLVLICLLLAINLPVKAHELKADGQIGVVLHIDPDDNPVNGSKTTYILYFEDTTNRFKLAGCICSDSITINGWVIKQGSINVTNNLESDNTIAFPTAGVYSLTVNGKPLIKNSFQSFSVSYQISVVSADSKPISVGLIIGAVVGVPLLIFLAYVTRRSLSKA